MRDRERVEKERDEKGREGEAQLWELNQETDQIWEKTLFKWKAV